MKLCLFALLLAVASFSGCSDDPATSGTNNSGLGTLVGKVYICNPFGEWTVNHSGVTLELEGTNFRTVSDSAGMWTINDIPPGTYILLIKKEGYVTNKKFNIIIAGKGTFYINADGGYVAIMPEPTYLYAEQLVLRPFEDKSVNYYGDSVITDAGGTRTIKVLKTRIDTAEVTSFSFRVRSTLDHSKYPNGQYYLTGYLYMSHDSIADYSSTTIIPYYYHTPYIMMSPSQYSDSSFSVYIEKKYLLASTIGFKKGEKIYCFGTVTTTFSSQYYYSDPTHPEPIVPFNTSPNHTEIKSFVIP
jgi:hypothetical protein